MGRGCAADPGRAFAPVFLGEEFAAEDLEALEITAAWRRCFFGSIVIKRPSRVTPAAAVHPGHFFESVRMALQRGLRTLPV